jgi:hypothetical protein
MNADELAAAVGAEASAELGKALARIKHCVGQLSDEQVWWRPRPGLNSIGNLILHLRGNIRQWITSGIGGTVDDRHRPGEFAERGPIAREELIRKLDQDVHDAQAVLARATARQLLEIRRIQGFEVTGLAAIFDSVPHFRGHTQEVVNMTRCQLGDKYQFAWKPATAEQGAPT